MYAPTADGITHINIYSRSQTALGRWLSNFTKEPMTLDGTGIHDGWFNSIEAYWYWLTRRDDRLRPLYGFNAKKMGKQLPVVLQSQGFNTVKMHSEFEARIRYAMWVKLCINEPMQKEFTASVLPFAHYYVFGGHVKSAGHTWIIEIWEFYRQHLKEMAHG